MYLTLHDWVDFWTTLCIWSVGFCVGRLLGIML